MTEVCQKSRNLKINLSQINKNDTFNDDGPNQSNKSINLVFNNISYSVRTNILSKKRKQLLFDISGDFRSGELTAIIGPSGAGKSTMMDILAGFTTSSVTGNIIVNGENRDLASFRRSSAYIMQDDNLQLLLTVEEAMDCAANLKLNTSASEKKHTVDEILVAMGLSKCRKTRTDKLSGGQRKRLVIALELVNNPPIMFFDEPTSGLDSVSSKQCLAFLKMLAREGRTIICTIHQPSATLFDMIDHLYVVSQGKCLYTGGTKNLVNFLASFQLNCPTYHNPADFILEICNGDYGDHLLKLVNSIENGKSNCWRSPTEDDLCKIEQLINENIMTPIVSPNLPTPAIFMKNKINGSNHATGFWMQLCILLRQNFIRLSRDRVLTYMRLSMHLIIAILVGIIFFNIGEDASYALDNYNLLFFNVMFLMFSAFSATLITFPLEVPVLTREHFNRWYKLRSFYLANKLADFPIQITATIIYTLIVYYMSGQVNEVKRLALYIFICIAISLVAQKIGLIVGIAMKLQNGVIFGPLFIMPFTIFSGFFIHMNDAQPFLQWLFHISFIKYGFEGIMVAIYGYDRPKMRCTSDYCHFSHPKQLLKAVGMRYSDYWYSIAILILIYIILDTCAFIILRLRLKQRFYR